MDAKDKRIAELKKRVAELEALLKNTEELLKAALEKIATLEKNSANSSKPPSSDIVKPPKDKPAADPKTKQNTRRKPIVSTQLFQYNVQHRITGECIW